MIVQLIQCTLDPKSCVTQMCCKMCQEKSPTSLWQLSEKIQMSGLLWRWWSGWSAKDSEGSHHHSTACAFSLPTPKASISVMLFVRCTPQHFNPLTPCYWVHEEKPPPSCSSDIGWILPSALKELSLWRRAAGRSLVQLVKIPIYSQVNVLHHLSLFDSVAPYTETCVPARQ